MLRPQTDRTDSEDEPIVAVDLFCGGGGFSEALKQTCIELGKPLAHAAINHWSPAIQSHERNHPHAEQYHSKIESLHPPTVIDDVVDEDVTDVHTDDVTVDILLAGPECTHFSNARGGKPVKEQKRASPWHVLDWLEKLDVQSFIIENTEEIADWGPVIDGEPSRDGTIFEAWINTLNKLGYSVNWTTLNAKHFGDPTSRKRFFLIGRQNGQATFPEPTHSEEDPSLPEPRTAAEIIDWSDLGTSIWTRDLTEPRVHTPPKDTTMQRIAEGIRRHCDDRLDPFAEVLEDMGREEIRTLREERVVPARYAGIVAEVVDEPFLVRVPGGGLSLSLPHLVKYFGTSPPQSVTDPLDTITSKGGTDALSTAQPVLLRQQDGAHPIDVRERATPTIATGGGHAIATPSLIKPKNFPQRGIHSNRLYRPEGQPLHTVTADPRAKLVSPSMIRFSHGGRTLSLDEPMPTIATERGGVFALSAPFLSPLYNPRARQRPRTRAVARPLMTVPASKSPAAVTFPLVEPLVDDYEGIPAQVDTPLGTVTSKDKFALCVPECGPLGLDIKYRMLKPSELKQAQGFPADYELCGTKADRTEQIGNAVPVNLGKALCKHVLTADDPSLASFGAGIDSADDIEIPEYMDVVAEVRQDAA